MKTSKIISMVLVAVMLVTAFPLSVFAGTAFAGYHENIDNYDDYGYYLRYDFENYGSNSNHQGYVQSTTVKNADGKLCNPFNMATIGAVNAKTAALKTETLSDGTTNKYYSLKRLGTSDNAQVLRFTGSTAVIGDSLEVSLRLRIHEGLNQTDDGIGESSYFPVVNTRRGDKSNSTAVWADKDGKIYAYKTGAKTLVYTPDEESRSEFTDIRFVWYDVSNTYTLYVNGEVCMEAMALPSDYRDFVTQTYDSTFMVDTRVQNNTDLRTLELCRSASSNGEKWGYDIDDIVVKAYHTAQDGVMYYENSFEGIYEGVALKSGHMDAYYYSSGVSLALAKEKDNTYLNVSGGFFALNDRDYQQYSQGNFVTEFKVKGSAVHTGAESDSQTPVRKPMIYLADNHAKDASTCVSNVYMLYVDQFGQLYLEDNAMSRIDGYTLNENEWLDVAVVAIRNLDNADIFSPFSSGETNSMNNTTVTLNYYINGQYVGTSNPISYFEWRNNSSTHRTAANQTFNMANVTVSDDNPALDLSTLVLVEDDPRASGNAAVPNHKIYRNSNASVYYDITFDGDTQVKYTSMTLTKSSDRYDTLRFSSENFAIGLDDIKVYGGTAPKWFYEAVNSTEGGELFDFDFSKMGRTGENPISMTTSNGQSSLGIIKSHNVTKNVTHNKTPGTASMRINNGMWLDFVVPTAKDALTRQVIYSCEATVKNITDIAATSEGKWYISLFTTRFEKPDATGAGGEAFFHIGNGTTLEELAIKGIGDVQLYNADGSRAMLDNENGSTLRADVKCDPINNKYTVSYYMDGEALYSADGSVACDMTGTSLSNSMKTYYGKINNFRIRALTATGYCYVDIDSIKFSVRSTEDAAYGNIANLANAGEVSGISMKLPAFVNENGSGLAELVSLTKGASTNPIVYADKANGALAVASGGKYYALFDKDGAALKLSSDETTDLVVVYNDIAGTARYYVNGKMAYISGEGNAPAVDLPIAVDSFKGGTGKIGARVALGFASQGELADVSNLEISVDGINDADTAEIIGFQTHDINGGIRIVAGVDSLYYGEVGFDVEVYENGEPCELKSFASSTVFSSILGDEMNITPAEYGYEYFSALNIHSLPDNIPENCYIIARSYVNISGVKHYDDYVKIKLSNDGYSIEDYITGQTLNMTELMDDAKALGRVVTIDSGLAIDHTASGFAFNFEGMGDVAINITSDIASTIGRISVTVDGKTSSIAVPTGTSTLVVAPKLKEGKHEISIINESGIAVPMVVNTVTFNGTLEDAPAEKDVYIEFIGDSITAGYGLYPDYVSGVEDHHNGALSYAYRTAQKLGADYAIFARSGMAIAFAEGGTNLFENRYPYASYVRNTTDLYTPTRTPDLVVINLAQNDNYRWYIEGGNTEGGKFTYEALEAKFSSMLDTVFGLYGEDTPILFVYGCMESSSYEPLVTKHCKELIDNVYTEENGYNISYVVLTSNRDAKDGHPDADGAAVQATELANHIKNNYEAFEGIEIEEPEEKKSLKILAIGNSFSRDATDFLYGMLTSAGIDEVVVGNAFIAGCTIEKHYEMAQSGGAGYTYTRFTSEGREDIKSSTLLSMITDQEWDIITLQQGSKHSGMPETFTDLQALIDYVKDNCPNPDVDFKFHMTWAYHASSKSGHFENYGDDQMTMYKAIVNAVQSAALTKPEISGAIPVGTAIQNIRTSYIGDNLNRDEDSHLTDIGRYTATLTWTCFLTGLSPSDIKWIPAEYGAIGDDIIVIRESVENALKTPYEVTNSVYTEKPELTLADRFSNAGLDINDYEAIDWEPKLLYCWNASNSVNVSKNSSMPQFTASKKFSKEELPIGTVIVVDEGYKYRPDAWQKIDETLTGTRPSATTAPFTVVGEEWWGDYNYRAFNLSKATGSDPATEEDIKHFNIYVPIKK